MNTALNGDGEPVPREAPPLRTTVSLSSPTCSLSGEEPFTVTTKHTNISDRPICALISLYTEFCHHVRLINPTWGPNRRRRKIGPSSTWLGSDDDDDLLIMEIEDSTLVRLDAGEIFELPYTFTTVPGMRAEDTRTMTVGESYEIELGTQKWWWEYEDEMPEVMSEVERKEHLLTRRPSEWTPDCVAHFTARP